MNTALLFDFDGTLANSAPFVTQAFDEAAKKMTGINRGPHAYMKYVGPPLSFTFRELGAKNDEEVAEWIRVYRSFYDKTMMDTPLFPGIAHMLEELKDAGFMLLVATSKNTPAARALLEHHHIDGYFDEVFGAPLSGNLGTKADRVGEALHFAAEHGIESNHAVMIGDRIHDIEGAHAHGIPCILVEWGAAPAEEYAMAWRTVKTPSELSEFCIENFPH